MIQVQFELYKESQQGINIYWSDEASNKNTQLSLRYKNKSVFEIETVHKKGEPSQNENFVFCNFNQTLNKLLLDMHNQQRSGDNNIQRDINRFLVCSSNPF
ncbi:MAG: hypothetical protein ACK56I_27870, partial [bacterium]